MLYRTVPQNLLDNVDNAKQLFRFAFHYGDVDVARETLRGLSLSERLERSAEALDRGHAPLRSSFGQYRAIPAHEIPALINYVTGELDHNTFESLTSIQTVGHRIDNPLKAKDAAWLEQHRLAIIDLAAAKGMNFHKKKNPDRDDEPDFRSHLSDHIFEDGIMELRENLAIRTRIVLHAIDHSMQAGKPWQPNIPQIFARIIAVQGHEKTEVTRTETAQDLETVIHAVAAQIDDPQSDVAIRLAQTMTAEQRAFWNQDHKIDLTQMPYATPEYLAEAYEYRNSVDQAWAAFIRENESWIKADMQAEDVRDTLIAVTTKRGPQEIGNALLARMTKGGPKFDADI